MKLMGSVDVNNVLTFQKCGNLNFSATLSQLESNFNHKIGIRVGHTVHLLRFGSSNRVKSGGNQFPKRDHTLNVSIDFLSSRACKLSSNTVARLNHRHHLSLHSLAHSVLLSL